MFEFQGQLRDLMVSSLKQTYLATGSYGSDAVAVSPQGAMSLASIGSSAGVGTISALTSPTLFVATANPDTLMRIGGGVGSAVMGAKGIVAQAPFVAVPSAMVTVGPLLAIQAINTAMMMQQFQHIDRKLDVIKSTVDRAIARAEATHAGELLSASGIVDEIYGQYDAEGAFSTDMLIRLGLAERDVRRLTARFVQLVDANEVLLTKSPEDLQQANYDAHSAMLSSFLDLRISYLRLCVDLQENPKSMQVSMGSLKTKIDDSIELWERLLHRSADIKT